MVYPGTKMCYMASKIQDMDARDDADIIAINLGTNKLMMHLGQQMKDNTLLRS